MRIPISVFSSVFGVLAPSSFCSFRDNGLEIIPPLVIDATDTTLPDFKVRRGEHPKDRFWSAGEEGVRGDTGMVSSLELAVRGKGVGACNGLALFPKDEDGTGARLVIAGPDESLGLEASDGVFIELSLGLGVTPTGDMGIFNEEDEDRVLIDNEDGGDEPKLIKARLASTPDCRSGPELGSGGVWVTEKPGLEQGSG